MTSSRRKTPFIGFLTAIQSAEGLFNQLVLGENPQMKYLLTYKLSQDHLELFFGAIRSSCGCNNNPTVRQFISAYKRLLMRHEIKAGLYGNCIVQDSTNILDVTADSAMIHVDGTDTLSASLAKRYNFDPALNNEEGDIDVPSIPAISPYKEAAIGYIAGYVVRMVKKRIPCPVCVSALEADPTESCAWQGQWAKLVNRKNQGGLVRPSASVLYICQATEKCFQRILNVNNGKLPQAFGIVPSIVTAVLSEVALNGVFSSIDFHMLESTPDSNHLFSLIKCISSCFCKIRMHHLAKSVTEKEQGPTVRKQLLKLVLFKHQ